MRMTVQRVVGLLEAAREQVAQLELRLESEVGRVYGAEALEQCLLVFGGVTFCGCGDLAVRTDDGEEQEPLCAGCWERLADESRAAM